MLGDRKDMISAPTGKGSKKDDKRSQGGTNELVTSSLEGTPRKEVLNLPIDRI